MATDVHSSITFTNIMGQGRINQLGGVFINGRPLPQHVRMKIVEMATNGVKPCHISRQLRVSHGCVSKILYRFAETGSISPGQIGGNARSRKTVTTLGVHIARISNRHPTLTANDIRNRLIEKAICTRANAPTIAAIHKYLRAHNSPHNCFQESRTPSLKHSIDGILGTSEDPDDGLKSEIMIARTRRNRTSFSQDQLELLEMAFKANAYPDQELRERIANATHLDESKIQVWFSNRRARCRKTFASATTITPYVFCANTAMSFLDGPGMTLAEAVKHDKETPPGAMNGSPTTFVINSSHRHNFANISSLLLQN